MTPKIFSNGKQDYTDIVHIFRLFTSHRPDSMKNEDSPFYLTPIQENKLSKNKNVWYYPTPMGVNTLGTLMKTACERAGISGKKTNHSIRKSTVTELSAAGVPPHKIIKITGHRQSSSIQHYDNSMSMNEHKEISSILCSGNKNPIKAPETETTRSSTVFPRKRSSNDYPILGSILNEP